MNPYLTSGLPLIDVLVLDEADRMIEDGHFKELKLLLDFVYTKRVEYKKQKLNPPKEEEAVTDTKTLYKEQVLKQSKANNGKKDFFVKEIEKSSAVDLSQVVDLFDEEGILEEMNPENLVIEADEEEQKVKERDNKRNIKDRRKSALLARRNAE